MKPRSTMREALADPQLLGNVFASGTWDVWRTLLIASMGEPLTDSERTVFQKFTKRRSRARSAG
jgi:hypothetical protein